MFLFLFVQKKASRMSDILICDFDDTITARDTISLLAKLPYSLDHNLLPWSFFTSVYSQNYHKYYNKNRSLPILADFANISSLLSTTNYRHILQNEFQYQNGPCRVIELSSIHELQSHGLFNGITTEHIRNYAVLSSPGLLRPGSIQCIQTHFTYIISVNWSQEFIHYTTNIPKDHIFCNDLVSSASSAQPTIITGADKVDVLERLLSTNKDSNNHFWYVGDSETDLLSILHPQVNGVLLLNPHENLAKFTKITIQIIGIPEPLLKKFMTDTSMKIWEHPLKQDCKFYICKTWEDISGLMQKNSLKNSFH